MADSPDCAEDTNDPSTETVADDSPTEESESRRRRAVLLLVLLLFVVLGGGFGRSSSTTSRMDRQVPGHCRRYRHLHQTLRATYR